MCSDSRVNTVNVFVLLIFQISLFACDLDVGSDSYGVCWIRDHSCDTVNGTNHMANGTESNFFIIAVGIYFGPYLIAYLVSLTILIFAHTALRKGLPNSDEIRKRVLKHSFMYVFIYALQWTIYAGLWFAQGIIFLHSNEENHFSMKRFWLAIIAAGVFGLNGVLDSFIWLWSGKSVFRFGHKDRKSKHSQQSNILSAREQLKLPLISDPGIMARQKVNAALRRDAMVCTSLAILESVNVGNPSRDRSKRNSTVNQDSLPRLDSQRIYKKWIRSPDGTLFEFKDYAPEMFAQLRLFQSVEADSYSTAFRNITKHDSEQELLEKFSDGKSGSFFYFSLDYRFIVKTVTKAELHFLQQILSHYYQHIKNNPDSLLTRIYGLHRIRLAAHQKYLSLVVMGNMLPHPTACQVHEKYDLKGSSVGRRVLKRNEAVNGLDLSKKTLKDCDLVRKIVIGESNKTKLMEQIRLDVEFLASVGVMDYSLLLGIHFCGESETKALTSVRENVSASPDSGLTGSSSGHESSENSLFDSEAVRCNSVLVNSSMEQEVREKYRPAHLKRGLRRPTNSTPRAVTKRTIDTPTNFLMASERRYMPWFRTDVGGLKGWDSHNPERRCVYFVGIIDILQRYNWSKKAERFWKTKVLCKDGDKISATNVLHYSHRFLEIGRHFK